MLGSESVKERFGSVVRVLDSGSKDHDFNICEALCPAIEQDT